MSDDQIELMSQSAPAPRPTYADRKRAVAARFVRDHVHDIIKKHKTAASCRTQLKKLMNALASSGEQDGADDIRNLRDRIEAAENVIEQHFTALIERTEIR
jgi:hypothetical protein